MEVRIKSVDANVPVVVTDDLVRFLENRGEDGIVEITLGIDTGLVAGDGLIEVGGRAGHWMVSLSGGDASGVICATYRFLEQLGYLFEIGGPVEPERLQWDALREGATAISPAVRLRGIRQHINFPMDLSSYPLDEAKEYIRNLGRMRFNHITFHSYTGQWFEVELADRTIHAGGFFYGHKNPLPQDAALCRYVRNDSLYCIPDIEPVYDDEAERSRRAMDWLRAVMREAKQVGMHVQFSFEPNTFKSTEEALQACDAILAAYPDIDHLELITAETGGWGPETSEENIRSVAREAFGEAFADSAALCQCMRECRRDLAPYLRDLRRVMDTVLALPGHREGQALPPLSCGLYCAVPALLRLSLPLMRALLPDTVGYAILASHGSRGVAHNLRESGMTKADWARTMVYSWIEFDGLMFLQQNPVRGIRQVLEEIADEVPLGVLRGMAFNHWRTAENATCARYAAEATLAGPLVERTFYRERAGRLGIARADLYAAAMMEIDDADGRATMELPNVGFCAGWGGDTIGILRWQLFDNAQRIEEQYEGARQLLADYCCIDESSALAAGGRQSLRLLDNRLQCTVRYLRAIKRAAALTPLCFERDPESLTDAERASVDAICDAALEQFDAYVAIFVAQMPDRGCEGLLVSFCRNTPAHMRNLKKRYGSDRSRSEQDLMVEDDGGDGPPLPILG